MARYTATTRLSPSEIIDRASKHFGTLSDGMKIVSKSGNSLCLESPDGYVTISICPSDQKSKKYTLDIETMQYDDQVREFLIAL